MNCVRFFKDKYCCIHLLVFVVEIIWYIYMYIFYVINISHNGEFYHFERVALYIYEGCSEIIETFTLIPFGKKINPRIFRQKGNQDRVTC